MIININEMSLARKHAGPAVYKNDIEDLISYLDKNNFIRGNVIYDFKGIYYYLESKGYLDKTFTLFDRLKKEFVNIRTFRNIYIRNLKDLSKINFKKISQLINVLAFEIDNINSIVYKYYRDLESNDYKIDSIETVLRFISVTLASRSCIVIPTFDDRKKLIKLDPSVGFDVMYLQDVEITNRREFDDVSDTVFNSMSSLFDSLQIGSTTSQRMAYSASFIKECVGYFNDSVFQCLVSVMDTGDPNVLCIKFKYNIISYNINYSY